MKPVLSYCQGVLNMAFVTVTKLEDGTDKVDIHERRPSWVVIEQASNMVKIDIEKSRSSDLLTTIKENSISNQGLIMAKKKAQFSASGIKTPDYKIIKSEMKPVSIGGIKRDYNRLMNEALWYTHQEVATKTLKAEFLKFAATVDKDKAKLLKNLPDYAFQTFGKYAYIDNKGAELSKEHIEALTRGIDYLLEMHKQPEPKEEVAVKPKQNVVSIKSVCASRYLNCVDAGTDTWTTGVMANMILRSLTPTRR